MNDDSPPPLLDAVATAAALPWPALVAELRAAVLELADGRIACPERRVLAMADGALLLSMPAVAADIAVHKLITVTPGNAARGLPAIRGQVSVIDVRDGRLLLNLDGPALTGRRTAAMSMLGLSVLWPRGPRHVLVVGTGAQAAHHVAAIAALHPSVRVSVRGSSPAAAERFCEQHPNAEAALHAEGGAGATGAAIDVVITCTSSRVPVYTEPARADRLLIAVGTFRPDSAEIGADTVRGSRVVVDDPEGARHEAGDLLLAGVEWREVLPLAEVLRPGGAAPPSPRLFKTVGCAAWDLAAARVVLKLRG